ncbi:hypothetical protein [Marinoscillum sp. MHG1-6]|uniref:hypothetical protein n=1 Tax=Marinoscillum sp. MHG1-6 TaxID=2959627 RepID=UPI00215775ED|nr:hypothetical protein [Marinoscillum sp. MHG1-6]
MSSHHIIRDEQEPALIIHKVNPLQWPIVLELLGWSPTVIVSEEAVDMLLDHGHKIDMVFCSTTRVTEFEQKLESQAPIKIQGCKSDDFLELAMTYLEDGNHKAVHVITAYDELFPQLKYFVATRLEVVIFTDNQKHILYRSAIFKKWLPAFSQLALIPLDESALVTTRGFDHDLDQESVMEGIELKKKLEGEISIHFTHQPALITENL